MIPDFNHSHVLPPFVGDTPMRAALTSPYVTTAGELVTRLGSTPQRCSLLRGFFAYRQALRDLGFAEGFQWLDGSFVENIEAHEDRTPKDVDVVTFAYKPAGLDTPGTSALMAANTDVFIPALARQRFGCDAYVVPLDTVPERLVGRAAYYHGLFSHRRSDNLWKGILAMSLQSDDVAALAALTRLDEGGNDAAST